MFAAMRDPLNQFAERLIRNGEVKEFIEGLIEKGIDPATIVEATKPDIRVYRRITKALFGPSSQS